MNHKIVKVTRKEIELENGDIYQFPIELDYDPTIEQIENLINQSEKITMDIIYGTSDNT